MKKVLYLSNIEVPYRAAFFNLLSSEVDLTVVYERKSSSNRDKAWTESVEGKYRKIFLCGANLSGEHSFSLDILGIVSRGWDAVIVGCINSVTQIMAMMYMRTRGIPFVISLDGELFISNGLKSCLKKFILRGASAYLAAGARSLSSIKRFIDPGKPVEVYNFSSMTLSRVKENSAAECRRDDFILVVGQYFDYKGMDVALEVARMSPSLKFKFVGMGQRTQLFLKEKGPVPGNVEVIPFLQKEDLYRDYRRCSCLVLPSRRECWGLVVNEAASFGTPIVSTTGSGAAVEFLSDYYARYLAKPGDALSLKKCIDSCLEADNAAYSGYLKEKSLGYSIERNVDSTLKLIREL